MRKNICLLLLSMIGSFSIAQTLQDYFKVGAENNPDLQAKYKRFEAAMQQVTQVRALPDPNLSFGYFVSPVETRVGAQRASLSLSQQFPWFGTLKAEKQATALMAESYYQTFLDTKNKLFYEISAAYYPLFELNQWVRIEQENIQILKSYKTISQKNFENGKGAMVDVLRVDLMLKDALTNLSILEQKKKPLEIKFNMLLDRSEDESVVVLEELEPVTLVSDTLSQSVLDGNPSLQAIDLKSQSYKVRRSLAVKKGLPKLGVGLTYTMVDERSDINISDNGKDVIMPMVSMSVPIFRKKYKAAQKEAQLMKQSIELEKRAKKNDLISNYKMVLFDVQQQQEFIKLYKAQIKISEQSLKLLFTTYQTSGNNFEEVLRMQQQVLNYEKKLASAKSVLRIALAKLDYITAKIK